MKRWNYLWLAALILGITGCEPPTADPFAVVGTRILKGEPVKIEHKYGKMDYAFVFRKDGSQVLHLQKGAAEGSLEQVYLLCQNDREVRALAPIQRMPLSLIHFGFTQSGKNWSHFPGGDFFIGEQKVADHAIEVLWDASNHTFIYSLRNGTFYSFYKGQDAPAAAPVQLGRSATWLGQAFFAADQTKVLWSKTEGDRKKIMLNDQVKAEYRNYDYYLMPRALAANGSVLVYSIFQMGGHQQETIVINDQKGAVCDLIFGVAINPVNHEVAYLAKQQKNYFLIYKGVKGQVYDKIMGNSLQFSPDGSLLVYAAQKQDNQYLIIGAKEIPFSMEYDGKVVFTPDGKHFACPGGNGDILLDEKIIPADQNIASIKNLVLTADGKNFACFGADSAAGKWYLIINGKKQAGEWYAGVDGQSIMFNADGAKLTFGAVNNKNQFVWVCKENLFVH